MCRWQIQPASRVCSVHQSDRYRLRQMRDRHGFQRGREEFHVRRVPQRDVFWRCGRGHHVHQVPEWDFFAREGRLMHEMPSRMVGCRRGYRVYTVSPGYLSQSRGKRRRFRVPTMSGRHSICKIGESRPRMQRVPPWNVPVERDLHGVSCWFLLEISVCGMQTVSRRDIFNWKCDDMHGM